MTWLLCSFPSKIRRATLPGRRHRRCMPPLICLAAVLLITAAGFPADGEDVSSQPDRPVVARGEVGLLGVVLDTRHVSSGTLILMSVVNVMTGARQAVSLSPPRLKQVVASNTALPAAPDAPETSPAVLAAHLDPGAWVLAVGTDHGSGSILSARVLVEQMAMPPALSSAQAAYLVFQQVQQMRLRLGIDPAGRALRWNSTLQAVADRRAAACARLLANGHPFEEAIHLGDNDPDGPGKLMTRLGYPHSRFMENLELRPNYDPAATFLAWERSPEHAQNYRQAVLRDAAVAYAKTLNTNGHPGYVVVMIAGAPRGGGSRRRG